MLAQINSPDAFRSHSMQYVPPEGKDVDFGDDQNVHYSDKKVKIKQEGISVTYLR